MTLDEREIETVILALRCMKWHLDSQLEGKGSNFAVHGAAWMACNHVNGRIKALIDKLDCREVGEVVSLPKNRDGGK